MAEKGKDRDPKIRVTDRRKFDSSGKPKDSRDRDPGPEPTADDTRPEPSGESGAAGTRLPEKVNFDFFVQSLHLQTVVLLGDLEDPTTGTRSTNLDAARFNIDVLGVLQEKTRGNLDRDEEEHLEGVLYDLRMRFARKAGPT
jgi:hypothetical protein